MVKIGGIKKMISIYLSNNQVQIVVGTGTKNKVTVKQCYCGYIAEANLINGVITNEAEFTEEIRELWEKYKLPKRQVGLVIDSTRFISRTATIPKLNRKKSEEIVRREFADVEEREDPLYDYMVLEDVEHTKMQQVLGTTVDRSFIEGFADIFEHLGIQITFVDLALSGAIRLLRLHPALQSKTCVIQVLDGDNLVSFLFINGKYKYSNSSRLFSEHGTSEFGVEIGRNVSSIVQFNASEKSEYEITDVYFAGFAPEDLSVCMEHIRALNLEAQVLPDAPNFTLRGASQKESESLGNYVYAIGGLLPQGMNFYTKYKKNSKLEEQKKKRRAVVVPLCILVGVLILASGVLIGSNLLLQRQVDELQVYVDQPLRVEQYQKSVELKKKNEKLLHDIGKDTMALQVLQSYPKPNSQILNAVTACAAGQVGITVDSYISETGIYSFIATANNVMEINQFIARLEQVKAFAKVDYTGYQFLDEKNVYNITVSCYLSETAGK